MRWDNMKNKQNNATLQTQAIKTSSATSTGNLGFFVFPLKTEARLGIVQPLQKNIWLARIESVTHPAKIQIETLFSGNFRTLKLRYYTTLLAIVGHILSGHSVQIRPLIFCWMLPQARSSSFPRLTNFSWKVTETIRNIPSLKSTDLIHGWLLIIHEPENSMRSAVLIWPFLDVGMIP